MKQTIEEQIRESIRVKQGLLEEVGVLEQIAGIVFDCIRGLMQHQDGLSFIFAGAHRLSAMLKNPRSILETTCRKGSSSTSRDTASTMGRAFAPPSF